MPAAAGVGAPVGTRGGGRPRGTDSTEAKSELTAPLRTGTVACPEKRERGGASKALQRPRGPPEVGLLEAGAVGAVGVVPPQGERCQVAMMVMNMSGMMTMTMTTRTPTKGHASTAVVAVVDEVGARGKGGREVEDPAGRTGQAKVSMASCRSSWLPTSSAP